MERHDRGRECEAVWPCSACNQEAQNDGFLSLLVTQSGILLNIGDFAVKLNLSGNILIGTILNPIDLTVRMNPHTWNRAFPLKAKSRRGPMSPHFISLGSVSLSLSDAVCCLYSLSPLFSALVWKEERTPSVFSML